MQDEPYIKAITNHIHLAQIWLISELEMRCSRLFVISLSFAGASLTFISKTEQIWKLIWSIFYRY